MNKQKHNQSGFSVIEFTILVFIITIIGLAGWFVWNQKKDTNNTSKQQETSKSVNNEEKKVALKEYSNQEYGFSFQYPETWKLNEDLSNAGRGHNEGNITVTSPNGTKVNFKPNLGGKGGDCWDEQANDRTTRTCVTTEILTVSKLSTSKPGKPVYFQKAKITEPLRDGGKTFYAVSLESGENAHTQPGSDLGLGWFGELSINNTKVGGVSVQVTGRDDNKNNSQEYFETQQIKEATPILESFKLTD